MGSHRLTIRLTTGLQTGAIALAMLLPAMVSAADPAAGPAIPTALDTGSIAGPALRMVLSLGAVLALVAGLAWLAQRLRAGLRSTDTLTRLSNWRFAILLEELKQPEDIQVVEQRMRSALDERLEVGERVYSLQAFSAGQVNAPGLSRSGDLLAAVEHSLRLSEQSQPGG